MKISSLYFLIVLIGAASTLTGQDLLKNTILGRTKMDRGRQSISQKDSFHLVQLFDFNEAHSRLRTEQAIKESIGLKLRQREIQSLLTTGAKKITLPIPVSIDRHFELELTEHKVLSDDFFMETSDGQIIDRSNFPVRFYRGNISNDTLSSATIVVTSNEISGLIADQNGTYVIGKPLDDQNNKHLIFNNSSNSPQAFNCGTGLEHFSDLPEQLATLEKSTKVRVPIRVFVECDFALYKKFGSKLSALQTYVMGLFNEVAKLYEEEDIPIELSAIRIWTQEDPYVDAEVTKTLLPSFARFRQNNYNGRLAHLLTAREVGGGRAFGSVLCKSYDQSGPYGPYAVSEVNGSFEKVPTYSWDVKVFTHEMGHNLGSPHTHDCVWNGNNTSIDDCGPTEGYPGIGCKPTISDPKLPTSGTIMSYCHLNDKIGINLAKGFGKQPGDLIRRKYQEALDNDCLVGSFCKDNWLFTGNIPAGIYPARDKITANGTIYTQSIVDFKAGNYIKLQSFHAKAGCSFTASIETVCGDDQNSSSSKEVAAVNGNSEAYGTPKIVKAYADDIQAYPNPSDGQVNIVFSLQEACLVNAAVYELNGRLVQNLLHSVSLSAGQHEILFDGSDLASGVYLCRCIIGSTSKIVRLVISR